MTEFKVPELGENVATGDVTKVLVNVGDTITHEQPVIELETDKATIEVPSSVAGVVKEIKVKKGDKVQVGAVIFTVEDGASAGTATSGNGAGKAAAAPAKPATTPSEPAAAAKPEPREEPKPESKPEPQKVVSMPSRQPVEAPPAPAPPPVAVPAPSSAAPAAASPGVRRLAREIGVDINAVVGSGPAGRISQDDVKEHARRILSSVGSAGAPAAGGAMAARASRPMPDFAKWGEVQREAWSNIRRVTSEHLGYSWNTVPHVTQFDKADVTALEELRKKYKDQVVKAGGNLTVTAMLVKILATALQKFPQFNASIDPDRGEIIYKKYVSVGVAVDTDR